MVLGRVLMAIGVAIAIVILGSMGVALTLSDNPILSTAGLVFLLATYLMYRRGA